VAAVTFSGSKPEVQRIRRRAAAAGVPLAPCAISTSRAAARLFVQGPEGHVFRFLAEKKRARSRCDPTATGRCKVTHVVLNAQDREACTRFAVDVLGFKLSDRTGS